MRLFLLVAAALVLAGCNGGTVDRHALTNDASTLDSIACEGALLAHDVARGRTTTYFAREQEVRRKAKDAAQLAATLQRLHDHPADEAVGADVERALKKTGNCP